MNKTARSLVLTSALALAFGATLLRESAQAAPFPGTATSTLVSPQLGVFRSKLGFQIDAGGSGWVQTAPRSESKFVETLYTAPGREFAKESASLSVRIDQVPKSQKETTVDHYVQRWLREYPRYGFDVLGSKPFAQNRDRGYVIDLINRDNGRELRQVVFVKKQSAVILTCRDQASSFRDSLKNCNQIVKTFRWTE